MVSGLFGEHWLKHLEMLGSSKQARLDFGMKIT